MLCLATHCEIAAMNCVVLFIFKTKSFYTVEKTLNCHRLPSKSNTVNLTVNVGHSACGLCDNRLWSLV